MGYLKQRYRVDIEYNGTNYFGFQKQQDSLPTIENSLVKALKNLTNQDVEIEVSGRTDAGVHAICQTIHFDLNKLFLEHQIVSGLNHILQLNNEQISVLECSLVDQNFHARRSSIKRYYRYVIINRKAPLAIEKNKAWHVPYILDLEAMKLSSQFLIGCHNFSSFRDSRCQAKSPIKTIDEILIDKKDEFIFIDICAKSFLHHMVRNIVGTLVYVGRNKILPYQVKEILQAKDRCKSGPNAPACGLYFVKTNY